MTGRSTKVTVITVDDSLPPVAQAASLALVLLRKVGAANMGEFGRRVLASDKRTITALGRIVLTGPQQGLLAQHSQACALVSPGPPRRTIAVCSACGQYLVAAGSAPSRCALTLGCAGTYTKVQPAKAEQVDADKLTASGQVRSDPSLEEPAGDDEEDEEPFDF